MVTKEVKKKGIPKTVILGVFLLLGGFSSMSKHDLDIWTIIPLFFGGLLTLAGICKRLSDNDKERYKIGGSSNG